MSVHVTINKNENKNNKEKQRCSTLVPVIANDKYH